MKDQIQANEEIILDSKCGVIKISIDRNKKYPHVLIKVNDIPAIMLEQSDILGTDMLYLKDYLHKDVHYATDFINYNKYGLHDFKNMSPDE